MKTCSLVHLLALVVLLSPLPAPVDASENATLTVCSRPRCDFSSIQDALDAAADGDTIRILDPLHREHAIAVRTSVTIVGRGPDRTVVQPSDYPNQTVNAVFVIHSGVVTTIQEMTIRGGLADEPSGGIQNNGFLTVDNAAILHNFTAASGGGIWS